MTDKALAALAAHPRGAHCGRYPSQARRSPRRARRAPSGGRGAGGLPSLERSISPGAWTRRARSRPAAHDGQGSARGVPARAHRAHRAAPETRRTRQPARLAVRQLDVASRERGVAPATQRLAVYAPVAPRATLRVAGGSAPAALRGAHRSARVHVPRLDGRAQRQRVRVAACPESLRAMVADAPSLRRARMEGKARRWRAGDAFASRALREVIADGCGRLESVRVAAPVLRVSARRCGEPDRGVDRAAAEPEEGGEGRRRFRRGARF